MLDLKVKVLEWILELYPTMASNEGEGGGGGRRGGHPGSEGTGGNNRRVPPIECICERPKAVAVVAIAVTAMKTNRRLMALVSHLLTAMRRGRGQVSRDSGFVLLGPCGPPGFKPSLKPFILQKATTPKLHQNWCLK